MTHHLGKYFGNLLLRRDIEEIVRGVLSDHFLSYPSFKLVKFQEPNRRNHAQQKEKDTWTEP